MKTADIRNRIPVLRSEGLTTLQIVAALSRETGLSFNPCHWMVDHINEPPDEHALKGFCDVNYDIDYVDDEARPGHRKAVRNLDRLSHVTVRLPLQQWWNMGTREGHEYIGPCCGTTGAAQDAFTEILRDGGVLRSYTFRRLAEILQQHEGFELWRDDAKSDDVLDALWTWDDVGMSGWDKLGAVWQLTKAKFIRDKLFPPDDTVRASSEKDTFERALDVVSRSSFYLAHRSLFFGGRDDEPRQNHANQALLNARLIPALRTVLAGCSGTPPFEGFALLPVDAPKHEDSVLVNRLGLHIYPTAEEATAALTSIAKWNEEFDPAKHIVLPVRVTAEEGLTFRE